MRVLFVVAPYTRGDINPYLSLTRYLLRTHDEVAWLALPEDLREYGPLVTSAGARILPTPPSTGPALPRGRELAEIFADPARYVRLQQRFVTEADERIERVATLLRTTRPDVIASDRLFELIPMQVAAQLAGVPHAYVGASLVQLVRGQPLGAEASDDVRAEFLSLWISIRSLIRRYGTSLRMVDGQPVSPLLNTAFTTEAFVGSDHAAKGISLVGPCIDVDVDVDEGEQDFPWERLRRDGRTIYASFGSLYSDDALYAIVAEAALSLDVQVVFSTAASSDETFIDRLPGDVLGVRYAPQLPLLAKVRAFVTHGGVNSVNESMFHGTPVLVVPFAVDQSVQAKFVERSGAGIAISRDCLTIEACRDALGRLLVPRSSYRDAAMRVRDSYRTHNGVKAVCEHLRAIAERAHIV
jgi:zeaxanthin glucosyltransferase